jgi:hypothetical protein
MFESPSPPSEEEIQTWQRLSFRRGDSNLTEIVLQKRRFKLDRDWVWISSSEGQSLSSLNLLFWRTIPVKFESPLLKDNLCQVWISSSEGQSLSSLNLHVKKTYQYCQGNYFVNLVIGKVSFCHHLESVFCSSVFYH